MCCVIIDEEEAENDGTGAEAGATRSSSVSEITFDKSLPRTHAVSIYSCLWKLMLQYCTKCTVLGNIWD